MQQRKLGRGVAVAGAGISKFGAFPEISSRDLFVEAFNSMRASVDRGLDPRQIEALYVGNFNSERFENQGHIAPILADWVGLKSRPATRVEDACASGGVALRQGMLAVASGVYDLVLVGGVEKMSGHPIEQTADILASAADSLYEVPAGFTFPAFYAAIASAYLAKYQLSPDLLMDITIKNHENGALNPNAHLQLTIPQAMDRARQKAASRGAPPPDWQDEYDFLSDPAANPMIASPLRLFDCSPVSDGAAVVLLASEDLARSFSETPIYIVGSGQASDSGLYGRNSFSSLASARSAAHQAYEMAGLKPHDIKLAEVHDCFTIAEVIATEDLGFFEPGSGARAAQDGMTARDGPYPTNTSGGLKAKGHPVGASGVGQIVEIWKQMRAEAGPRQVKRDVNLALAHNVGGTGQSSAVHIFERR
jgi:acetyl-CoA C-acetyltransferase